MLGMMYFSYELKCHERVSRAMQCRNGKTKTKILNNRKSLNKGLFGP